MKSLLSDEEENNSNNNSKMVKNITNSKMHGGNKLRQKQLKEIFTFAGLTFSGVAVADIAPVVITFACAGA